MDGEYEANACLVAAAPGLLAACEVVLAWITAPVGDPVKAAIDPEYELRAAIAKARGAQEQPPHGPAGSP